MIDIIKELLLAGFGTMGFSLVFKVPVKRIIYTTIGGVVCWATYIIAHRYLGLGILSASLFSTVITSLYAEIIARLRHVPTWMIAITAYVPLIPGAGLYYCMSNAVAQNWPFTATYAIQTLQCALGMALGMSLTFAFFAIRGTIRKERGELPQNIFVTGDRKSIK